MTNTSELKLEKGFKMTIKNVLYDCYNVTSIMHFVKCGVKGQRLSPKNKENFLNLTKEQVIKYIGLGTIKTA